MHSQPGSRQPTCEQTQHFFPLEVFINRISTHRPALLLHCHPYAVVVVIVSAIFCMQYVALHDDDDRVCTNSLAHFVMLAVDDSICDVSFFAFYKYSTQQQCYESFFWCLVSGSHCTHRRHSHGKRDDSSTMPTRPSSFDPFRDTRYLASHTRKHFFI